MTTQSQIRASMNPEHLRKLQPFVSTLDIRYYLTGICIEKCPSGGAYLIACDGHTLCVVHDSTATIEGAESVIFRLTPGLYSAAKLAGKKKSKGPGFRLLVQGQRVKIATDFDAEGDSELFIQAGRNLIEGKFPDWKKVVPEFDKLKRGCVSDVNAMYLSRLAKVSEDRRYMGCSIWQESPDKAMVVRFAKHPDTVVVVMPMRESQPDPALAFEGFPLDRQQYVIEEPALEPA